MAMDQRRLRGRLKQALKDDQLAETIDGLLRDYETDDTNLDVMLAMRTELSGGAFSVAFTVNAESGNDITINVQANDEDGNAVTEAVGLTLYVVTTAAATAFETDDYTIAAGTDGAILQVVADNIIEGITESDGDLDIVMTIAGSASCFLAWKGPTGKLTVSDEIAHTA